MTLLRSTTLLFALASCAVLSRATTITYNLSGATTSAGALTGTIAIDSSSNRVVSADLILDDPTYGSPTFNFITTTAAYNGLSQTYIVDPSSGPQNYGGQLALFLNTRNVGSGSLSICTADQLCGSQGVEPSLLQIYSTQGTVSLYLEGGTLSQAGGSLGAVTPEPAGLVLLGTGILSVAGLMLFWPSKVVMRSHPPQLKIPS